MRTSSNSRGLAALLAVVGLAVSAPFAGCGGDSISVQKPPPGSGGAGGEGGAGGDGGGGDMPVCGNKVIEGVEACDDGNMEPGDGCEPDCSLTCNNATPASGDAKCDDKDPCNGAEKCQDDHTCSAGTPAADGTTCGTGKICKTGVCLDDTCGDLFISKAEECEDGNVVNGDGCDSCKYSCLSSDPARDCSNLDPCLATACDDATHMCGNPKPEGSECGIDKVCRSGACTNTVCGDGVVDFNEMCDDANVTDGDGCDADCTLSCVNAATDCPVAPVCQTAACTANFVCTTTNVPTHPMCNAPNSCQNGACLPPSAICGNGTVEPGEECDRGAANGQMGSGCAASCQYVCDTSADCDDMNSCNGAETCTDVKQGMQTVGKLCTAGMNQANCLPCNGGLCNSGVCAASTCGDGCVDGAAGEQCEPPNTATCDAMCKTVAAIVCGNGVRQMGEQCDDGNTTNTDGCDSACKFEQSQRVNWLAMQYATDAYCTVNKLGLAIASAGQSTITDALTTGVNDGSISIIFRILGLDDLTGTTDPAVQLGSLNGTPIIPMGTVYNGASDLDWWYTIDPASLDANRMPVDLLNGSIAAKVLTAGPGLLTLKIVLGGSPATLNMSNAKLTSSIGAISTPLSSMGNPPGHVASENLDPALQSYATQGQPNASGAGKLCGNVTAASLKNVPIPMALLSGTGACIEGYTATNTMLDVIVNGCRVLGGLVTVISKAQPDQQNTAAPDVGAGFPYTLTYTNATKTITACRDKNNVQVDLTACLQDAAYSSFFKFATDRVIGK